MSVEITVQDVKKRFVSGTETIDALRGISLRIEPGSTMAVVGPSGSGKSTLLHLMGGMDVPDDGVIMVGSTEVSALRGADLAKYRGTIGFVFQRFHLLPTLSVLDNVAAPLLPRRTSFDKHKRALDLLTKVGLESRAKSLPSRLSGGQQQRVAVARALMTNPVLILADEPTGNLDTHTGGEVMELLHSLCSGGGPNLVLATHDAEVAKSCDRIVVLRDGAIVEDTDSRL